MALDRPLVRAPEFPPVEWINSPAPPHLADLQGQVLLVDVWDFTCINCLRTLPTLRDWHMRYSEYGLATIGVHTPEFPFACDRTSVQSAIGRLGIRWPVGLDNEQAFWTALANRVWPTVHLIDRAGYVRYRREGEAGYGEIETALRALLSEGPPLENPLPPPMTRDDEPAGGACLPSTPELHAESVGNGQLPEEKTIRLTLPTRRTEGAFYLEGQWRTVRRGLTLESQRGEIVLPFQAAAVHAVFAPGVDHPSGAPADPAWVEVLLDGEVVIPDHYGQDLQLREGSAWLRIDAARSFDILQSLTPGRHELCLRLISPGTTLYAFSFDACWPMASPSRSDLC
jgi:hypothetical protein